jgi:hypothetical protein
MGFSLQCEMERKEGVPGDRVDEGPEEGGGVDIKQGQGLPYRLTIINIFHPFQNKIRTLCDPSFLAKIFCYCRTNPNCHFGRKSDKFCFCVKFHTYSEKTFVVCTYCTSVKLLREAKIFFHQECWTLKLFYF